MGGICGKSESGKISAIVAALVDGMISGLSMTIKEPEVTGSGI